MQSNATSDSSSPWYLRPERGSEWGLRFMMLFYRLCGKFLTRVLLYPVVTFFFLTDRAGRQLSREFFERIFQHSESSLNCSILTHPPGIRDDFQRFYNFGCSMVDRIEVWGGTSWTANVTWHGLQHFDCLQEKDGAILMSAHIGNLEALRVAAKNETEKTIKSLVYTENSDHFMKVLNIVNPDILKDVVPIQNIDTLTMLKLKNLIDEGNVLGLVADRVTVGSPERVIEVPFLGDLAPFPQGPWILAALLRCPIYIVFCVRTGQNRYEVFIEPFADKIILPGKQREAKLRELICSYALSLEKYCCLFPHHWFNFYDFWSRSSKTSR